MRPWNTPRDRPGQYVLHRLAAGAVRRLVHHDRGHVADLVAPKHLGGVQVHGRVRAAQPGMELGTRGVTAERQREGVVETGRLHVGIDRGEVERVRRLILQADMRQRGTGGDVDLRHRIMQVAATTQGDLDHSQPCPVGKADRVAGVERDGTSFCLGGQVHQQHGASIHAGGHGQDRAVFGQHRVQGDNGLLVGARQRAELGVIRKPCEAHRVGCVGQIVAKASVHEDQTWCVDLREGWQLATLDGSKSLAEVVLDQRTQAGILPCLAARAGEPGVAKRGRRGVTGSLVTRKAGAQAFVAREETARTLLERAAHAAAATMSAYPFASSSKASSAPPERTMRPADRTCTRSGTM